MSANQPVEPPAAPNVPCRSEYVEGVQCPCCHMFFGLYLDAPYDAAVPINLLVVPPENMREFHDRVTEFWRSKGALRRDHGALVDGSTN